jgi:phosphatidylglycerophosphate synthase
MSMAGPSVPDVATLRAICHREKLARDRRPWYAASRQVSIYLTWLLAHTGVTANQVTLFSVLLAGTGGILIAAPPASLSLCGALALLAYHLLDKVDGDIARFRKTFSIVGVYLDEVGHAVALAGILLGLGLHLAWGAATTGQAILLLAAASLGSISMVVARHHKSAGFLLFSQYVLVQPGLLSGAARSSEPHPLSREAAHRSRRGESIAGGWPMRALIALRDTVLMSADFVTVLSLVLAGLITERLGGGVGFLTGVLFVEAPLQMSVLLALFWINATTNVRSECLRLEALVRDRASGARP